MKSFWQVCWWMKFSFRHVSAHGPSMLTSCLDGGIGGGSYRRETWEIIIAPFNRIIYNKSGVYPFCWSSGVYNNILTTVVWIRPFCWSSGVYNNILTQLLFEFVRFYDVDIFVMAMVSLLVYNDISIRVVHVKVICFHEGTASLSQASPIYTLVQYLVFLLLKTIS